MKASGNLKELMILLRFLPRAIMRLFYKRAAAPIIQIIPFPAVLVLEKRRNTCSVPRKGAQPKRVPGTRDWKSEQELLSQNLFRPVMSCEPLSLTQSVPYKYLLVYSNYLGIRNS